MTQKVLTSLLRRLDAAGPNGFEGLVLGLTEDLTGYPLYLARSGDQGGRDMRSARHPRAVIAVECKRYGSDTELDKTELIGKLTDAATTIPHLDSWVLVASRAVSDQLYTSIERVAQELRIEFSILSAADGTPSTLEVLCANSPNRVLAALRQLDGADIDACSRELSGIRQLAGFANTLDRLREELQRSAAYEWWRRAGHRWLVERFQSVQSSHAAFGQVLNVAGVQEAGRLIPRAAAREALDRWYDNWARDRQGLVVTGEEGDGKTWAVASWLLNHCNSDPAFPPIAWLGARDISNRAPGHSISEALATRLGRNGSYWAGHLTRWFAQEPTASPTLLIVLDGLNERHSQVFWREFLQSARAFEWRAHVALLATTRTEHWRYYRGLDSLGFGDWPLGPFDDAEFALALRAFGLSSDDIPARVRPLARKPRYFDLVVQHRGRLVEAGDVTVARLVYEDWRDRFERKVLPLDDIGFRDLLKALARRVLNDDRQLYLRDVANLVPLLADQQHTLSELATGGILVTDGALLSVEPHRLQLGFGLLLAERLRVAASTGEAERLEEVVGDWLDGLPDTALRAGICEAAAFHALRTAAFSTNERAVLLDAWLRVRNPPEDISQNVSAYFPLDPQAYFAVAESVWAAETDDPAAQRILMRTFRRWSTSPEHRPSFVGAFERWLGFVHVHGSPTGIRPEERSQRRLALIERLGRELQPGPFTFEGFDFNAINDDGLLRLGRVALSVISGLERRDFLNAVVIGVLAEAIHAYPEKHDLFSWVVRTSPTDLTDDIVNASRALILSGKVPARQAAYRLLSFEASAESIALRSSLPDDTFPPNPLLEERKRDPCASGFAWKREHVAECASRDDIHVYHLAQQLRRFCAEEHFRIPANAVRRLGDAGSAIDVSRVHLGPGCTEPDVRLEQLEPALCAGAPTLAADIYRRLAKEVAARDGHSLLLLLHFLNEHLLILGSAERDVLLARWNRLREVAGSDGDPGRHNEPMLVRLMFSWLNGTEQLAALLARHPDDPILVATDQWISATSEDELATALENSVELTRLQRVLYFIAAQPQPVSSALAQRVAGFAAHSDSWTRASALRTVYRSGDPVAARVVVNGSWHWRRDALPDENHFGSLVIARYGLELPYEELRARVEPPFLGFAVECRGQRPDLVDQLATDIDSLWRSILNDAPLPPTDCPRTELRVQSLSALDGPDRIGLAASAFSREVTFRARGSVWGGDVPEQTAEDFRSFFEGPSDTEFAELQRRMAAALAEQREAGNMWFGRRFSTSSLAAVCTARGELVETWLRPVLDPDHPAHVRAFFLARSFYESICSVLLQTRADLGIQLYFALKAGDALTTTSVGFARLNWLDLALFSAPASDPLRDAWERRLAQARTDADLLEMAVATTLGNASEWLEHVVRRDLRSEKPLWRARAVTLCGFLGTSWAADVLRATSALGDDIWLGELAAEGLQRLERDRAAQHQLRRLMREVDTDQAWAAFRLLLTVVDRRIALWYERIAQDAADRKRVSFLDSNAGVVEKAISTNEKPMREHFLGQQVREGQVWPWIED